MFHKSTFELALGAFLVAAPVAIHAGVARGAEDHAHAKGPHGGDVKTLGKYHLEGVRAGEALTFYLLADDGKAAATIEKVDGGTITVLAGKSNDKTEIPTGPFSELSAKAPATGKVTALLALKVAGNPLSAKFVFN